MQGAEKIQGAEEGSLPEWCNSEGRLLIKKRGLSEWCNSEGRFLNKETSACRVAQFRRNSEDREDIGGELNFPGNNFHFVLLSGDCSMDDLVFSVIHLLFSFPQSFLIIYLLFLFFILIFLW